MTGDFIMSTRVGMVSLGCPKNQVDAEHMLYDLKKQGFEIITDAALADVVIVNTCGFIESAKQEAIDTILEFCELKKEGRIKAVIATGCLAERYRDEMKKEMPEIDAVIGIGLNVNQTTFVSDAPNPVSLCQITGYEMNREALLDEFLKRLDEALHDETVPTDYRSRLYRRDGLFAYRDQEGLFRARLKDVLPDGRLLLTDEAGQDRTYAFKEVQFVI